MLAFLLGLSVLALIVTLPETLPTRVQAISKHGNLMWYNRPVSFTKNGATFISHMTSEREIVVTKLDQKNTQAESFVVDQYHYLNDHGSPILHSGNKIGSKNLLIYNLHNSPIYTKTSSNADSID